MTMDFSDSVTAGREQLRSGSDRPSAGHRVLVTGGAGFIGSHVCEALLERGDEIVILDNLDPFYDPALKRRNLVDITRSSNCLVIEGDIRDAKAVRAAFAHGPYSAVVHLAARAGVRPSLEQALLYEDVNVAGTVRLLEALRGAPATHFVLGSSSSVYGATSQVPFSESACADRPSSPYAASKRNAEVMAYTYHHLYGIPVTGLRFFTVYGPRQRPEMAIHKFTRQILSGDEVEVYGDGTDRRDFTYVDDVVRGVVAAVDSPSGYQLYNLGTRDTTAVLDLVRMLGERLGRSPHIHYKDSQSGDVPITLADITRAERDLAYEARTRIDEGLDRFIAWYLTSRLNA